MPVALRRYNAHVKRFPIWLVSLLWVPIGIGWGWATFVAAGQLTHPPAVQMQAAAPVKPSAIGVPLSRRVVLIVLSGVGAADLNDPANPWAFSTLRRLAAEGRSGISSTVQPSGDVPTMVALMTGSTPPRTGIIFDDQVPHDRPAALTSSTTSLLIATDDVVSSRSVATPGARLVRVPSSDRVGAAAAEQLRTSADVPLTIAVLDLARRSQYTGSLLHERLDNQIAEIAGALDRRTDTLVVTADHGKLPGGEFGGAEIEVTETPFVLWGAAINPGRADRIRQIDLAPTMALLLGQPFPPICVGRPLTEALQLDGPGRAAAWEQWTRQRVALQRAGGPGMVDSQSLSDLESAREAGNWNLVEHLGQTLDTGMAQQVRGLSGGSVYIWSVGLPLVLLVLGRLLALRGMALFRWILKPLFAAEIYCAAWAVIYWLLAGRTVSFSFLYHDLGGNLRTVAEWAGLALLLGAVPLCWLESAVGPRSAANAVLNLAVVLNVSGAAVMATIAVIVRDPLADTTAWSGLLLVGAQLAGIGIAVIPVALIAAAITDVLTRGR
ncbi:MAG: hypothetical protein NVS2B7_31260 [Herpetosiphon sp.]